MTHFPITFDLVSKSFAQRTFHGSALRALWSKRPLDQKSIIQNLSCEIHLGEKVLLCGPNGTGKTTFLKLACGILVPDSGTIYGGKSEVSRIPKERFGIMLGHLFLYPQLSVYENLEFAGSLYQLDCIQSRIEETIETWNLGPFLHKSMKTLSRGQRSLAGLARSTLHAPDVLLWDEPHLPLSEDNLATLVKYIQNSKQTIILASPLPFEPSLFDRTIQL